MSLKSWLANGWLTEHTTSPAEILEIMAAVERDLVDCRVQGLSADWRLNIAYNAALRAATAALAVMGYRATREQHHYRVAMSLTYTVGSESSVIQQLDMFRK